MTGTPDYGRPVRKVMLAALKKDTSMIALVPAASIYPGTVPAERTLPFIRRGSALASPFRATGLDSSSFRISLQAFSQGVKDANETLILPAEDHIDDIGSAIKMALDGSVLPIPGVGHVTVQWIQTSPTIDPSETQAWMTTVTFSAEVAG